MSRSNRGRGSSSFAFSEGDWTCPGCSNINFARRLECNRCGEQKQPNVKKIKKGGVQIGKAAAEKSRGLFSADDWICKTCGNVNWARRSECNMCNTPKVGVQEERTGFGGGFNERQNVEYKPREDSDDEFDQYGRKKRRKNENGAPQQEQKKVISPPSDDDDEESDDDNEDLSKYDLDEDDDDDEEGDASKYDLGASDDDSKSSYSRSSSSSRSRSLSRSPRRKRRYSSDSSGSGSKRNSSVYKRHRSRSRSSSSGR